MNAGELEARLLACVRCAACRETCPTYVISGRESATPRGRIALMLAEHRGEIPLDAEFQHHIDLCTGCRACEAACPSGVEYGVLLDHTRAKVRAARPRTGLPALVERLALHWLVPNRRRLRLAARLLRLAQRPALRWLIRAVLPPRLRTLEALAPALPPVPGSDAEPVAVAGPVRAQAAFFAGCVAAVALPAVDRATLQVLARAGCQVAVPAAQTCCGALHAHSGDREYARRLARRNIDAFPGDGPIVTNSAGCGAMLKEYAHLLADDPAYRERTGAFARRVQDVTEYLDRIGPPPLTRPLPLRVAIQDPCHLNHVQRIRQAPRRLLEAIGGLTLVEPAQGDLCCGAAGTYNLTQPAMAGALLAHKVEQIRATGATVLATANPGCYLHLQRGLAGAGVQVLHVVELLEEASRPC